MRHIVPIILLCLLIVDIDFDNNNKTYNPNETTLSTVFLMQREIDRAKYLHNRLDTLSERAKSSHYLRIKEMASRTLQLYTTWSQQNSFLRSCVNLNNPSLAPFYKSIASVGLDNIESGSAINNEAITKKATLLIQGMRHLKTVIDFYFGISCMRSQYRITNASNSSTGWKRFTYFAQ